MRRTSRQVQRLGGAGRRASIVQAVGRGKDPGCMQGAPAVKWANEWWEAARGELGRPGCPALGELHRIFGIVKSTVPEAGSWKQCVKAPVSAAFWGCRIVNRCFASPGQIVDEDDVSVNLMQTPPVRLDAMHARALRRAEVSRSNQTALSRATGVQSIQPGQDHWIELLRRGVERARNSL